MIQTGFETRIKVQQIIENQLPEFILDENPKAVDFLKQYYISQEYQSAPIDISENLDQYIKLDNLTPEVVVDTTKLSSDITSASTTIVVTSTKGFPNKYGLLKIDDEIITYTGITTNTFIGCIRGFSGITTYHSTTNPEELVFSTSSASIHTSNASVQNLSTLFLKEFYKKLKYSLTPGLEQQEFVSDLNAGTFIKNARAFYQSKGTNESFRILFEVLFGVKPKIVNLEDLLLKPSSANYVKREIIVAEAISGDPNNLVGQSIVKSTDSNTNASVSGVEIITREGNTFYKISLFIGHNDSSAIRGTFSITPNTKVVENVSVGSSVITVDSTIGFSEAGNLVFGTDNTISYTSKSINQFFGCSGIPVTGIDIQSNLRSDEYYYGYENGDVSKKVKLRITGVISNFIVLDENYHLNDGDEVYVKNIGEVVDNSSKENKSYKQILTNSWIYNTSSRYQVKTINGPDYTLYSPIDKSSLKVNDKVEILKRNSQEVISSPQNIPYINNIDLTNNKISLGNLGGLVPSEGNYDIRKKINKASSTTVPIEFGNDALSSDIQNTYLDDDNHLYVASNSLPSYPITKNIVQSILTNASGSAIQGYDSTVEDYSIISFDSHSFITGDKIYYQPESTVIPGLTTGFYYAEVQKLPNQIKLYPSRSLVGTGRYLRFYPLPENSGKQYFTLYSQKINKIGAQKLLKKFPINNIVNGNSELTKSGSVGMLINGVEILNYKSNDKVYYGPLESVDVINGGEDYDVINPPLVTISSGIGTTALVQPIIRGSIKKIFVDPQEFDINSIVSIAVTGGNGSGAILEPIIQKKRREIEFDAREDTKAGGVNAIQETITFLTEHKLSDGEEIIYNSNGNLELGIGNFNASNIDQNKTLKNGTIYYPKIVNNNSIKLYDSLENFTSGINTIGFTTANTAGIQKFETVSYKNVITEIKVLNGGKGYENRKLIVNPSQISIDKNTITYPNHNFNDGELLSYSYQTSIVSGLSTSKQYYVIKVDSNSFRLADAGIGGTNRTDYQRKKYVKFSSIGSGYQTFKYPDIKIDVKYSVLGTGIGNTLVATPIVRGSIVDTYLYNVGTGYGSTVLNEHKKPLVSIKNGKNAQLNPIIVNGKINRVNVQFGGYDYYSLPDLILVSDSGSGASIRPIISNGKIVDTIVINPGIGYSITDTIKVKPAGSKAILDVNVRSLTVNNQNRFGNELLQETNNNLQYSVCGYFSNLRTTFGDPNSVTGHSPIIGWAYDGNPIYGPYGYSDPENNSNNSTIRVLKTGYNLSISNVYNRPSGFPEGFFVDDYKFIDNGDLDQNNGRFCKTPEFKNGIYAYFAGIHTSTLNPVFPYFIGNTYKSRYISDNSTISQNFDFNNSTLIRNTFPYKVNDSYAGNDFVTESYEISKQKSLIESVTKGSIDSFEIVNKGENYKVLDHLKIDNDGTYGGGLDAIVSSITGEDIVRLDTTEETYQDAILSWKDGNHINVKIQPYHNLFDGDNVIISGLTSSLSQIDKFQTIGISSYSSILVNDIPANVGVVTDIYISQIPESISIGSSITIENEILSVLNVYNSANILRVKRGVAGASHTATTKVNFIPDSFTILESTNYFDSKVDDKVFFNPNQSIGIGESVGVSTSINFVFASNTFTREIPTQSIYIENHPFTDNQKVTIEKPNGSSAILAVKSFGGEAFNLPLTGNSQIVYVTKKTKDTIGIKTELNSSELFFINSGSNNYEYSLKSDFDKVVGKIEKIKTVVSVSTSHNLSNGDKINLEVIPSLSVGIGTSTSIYVKYNSATKNLLINPLGFNSTGINTSTDVITINSHNLKTGDKVLYSATDLVASGLSTQPYYVYKIDDDTFNLSETYIDSKSNPPTIVSIASTGGKNQEISLINPQITSIKNNKLIFNLSDSSLSGYKFKLFYDENFNNHFVATGTTDTFATTGIGTIGISTDASLTLNYFSDLPTNLFYALEKSGYISTSDKEVTNGSKITFIDSAYNGSYTISGIGTTTFNISLKKSPEKLNYSKEDCDTLKYSTSSLTASGGINKIKILTSGSNYRKIPKVSEVESLNGKGSYIIAKSESIGKVNQIKLTNQSYNYSSDNTLRPTAYISPEITLDSANVISGIEILDGGKNYIFAPDIIVVDSVTRKEINNGLIEASLTSNSITSVNIINEPKGLSTLVDIFTKNNSNGTSIDTIESSSSGIVTCYLTTPIDNFSTAPFSIGDKIFVEGIQKLTSDGTGFNSEDYGYKFFTVTNFTNLNPAKLEYSVSGVTTNPGIAKTSQQSFASIINYRNYPKFNITLKPSNFQEGEKIYSSNQSEFIERDLKVVSNNNSSIKVFGSYDLSVGEFIRGATTGNIGKVNKINNVNARFNIGYASTHNIGWIDNVGKLDEDYQVLPDNDYYQNLSYTIKSPVTFESFISPVNNLVHTSGLKNFADTEILSSSKIGIGSTSITTKVYDVIDEKRIDMVNLFAFTRDANTIDSKSKFLKLKNKKLTNYINCISNRCLVVDDISYKFSSKNFASTNSDQNNLLEISPSDSYGRFLIQILNKDSSEIELKEVTILNDGNNLYTIENGSISNTNYQISDIFGYVDENGTKFLRFNPTNPYDNDYTIKIIEDNFNTNLPGIGTTSIGFVKLIGITSAISSGITTSIVSVASTSTSSLYSNIQVVNTATNEMNFVELYLNHDGTNTYISEYYFDSNYRSNNFSNNFIGSFGASLSSGILSLNYTNTTNNNVTIRSKVVGFGTTSVGIGTYRFKSTGQLNETERTAIYEANYKNISSQSNIISFNRSLFSSFKSLIEVSIGSSKALHQISLVHDNTNINVVEYPFLSIGGTNGIGTFGGEFDGTNVVLKFYPNAGISGNIKILTYTESFYADYDFVNIPDDLTYGSVTNTFDVTEYNSINGENIDKLDFDLNYKGYPIFKKVFNPADSSVLNLSTGTFTIKNHFFNTGEEITYAPKSSFIGIGQSSLLIGPSTILPSTVYVYKITEDTFKLATTKNNALSGICVTFTSYGEGNAHELEMTKKLEKSIITIDNIVQYPISYTPLSYTLSQNSGQITDSAEVFTLSGISSIKSNDVLKVDNEYMKIVNVGFGTTNIGPITNSGSIPLVEVSRGFVGSSATSHTDSTTARIYRGSYNISGNKIYFTQSPSGYGLASLNSSNLNYPRSKFNGRIFLRKDYTTNKLYDSISDRFTGIGQTYTLTVNGSNATGVGTTGGNGIVFVNNIFQSPTTQNNSNNNFNIIENTNVGITSIVFTGITSTNGSIIKSIDDINQNQLPRGGIIVSLGSTSGLGYAPLVGASVTAVVSGGSIISVGLGSTDILGSGYYGNVSIGVTDSTGSGAIITANVGAGGSLSFTVVNGGNGYTNPKIITPSPSYSNLSVIGVSRLGIGTTTATGVGLLLNLSADASATTGIGSTLFEISKFSIMRSGYGFNKGDVIKPVGLVTAKGLSSPLKQFEITVLDTYTDSFAAWQFGEIDYIDSIKKFQDGIRITFPLYYNSRLLSFEADADSQIDLNSILLIFINGVIQEPGLAYQFTGGSTFTFTTPPKYEDNISIFFYRGTREVDSILEKGITESIKPGDSLQVLKDQYGITPEQNIRTVYNLSSSDTIETNLYLDQGVDSVNYRPMNWIKQKIDKKIDDNLIYKTRDSIESMIYPTAKIIGDFSTTDTQIFVENVELFNYENSSPINFDALIVQDTSPTSVEKISGISNVTGFSGIITGIGTTSGIGTPLALKFYLSSPSFVASQLTTNYPIYIFNTNVGKGVTSIYTSNSNIVGIGTTFLDNIYNISAYSDNGSNVGIITCNILSTTSTQGLTTSGAIVGEFSWGKMSGFSRSSSPVSIAVTGKKVDVGLTTFASIQRRGYGLRDSGSLKVIFNE